MQQLERMTGKTWLYKNNNIHIVDIDQRTDGNYLVFLPGDQTLEIHPDGINQFINDCLPVEQGMSVQDTLQVSNEKNVMDDVQKILMDNIRKVQDDAGYINQAKVVNNSIAQVINLTKTKLEILKLNK